MIVFAEQLNLCIAQHESTLDLGRRMVDTETLNREILVVSAYQRNLDKQWLAENGLPRNVTQTQSKRASTHH